MSPNETETTTAPVALATPVVTTTAAPSTTVNRDLTFDDLLNADDSVRPVTVNALKRNGVPVTVYLRMLSAQDIFDFIEMPADTAEEVKTRSNRPFELLAKSLVNSQRQPLVTSVAELFRLPMPAVNELTAAMLQMLGLFSTPENIEQASAAAAAPNPGTSAPATADAGLSITTAAGKD